MLPAPSLKKSDAFDFLITGAGFSGLVAAERLCSVHGKRCLVVEKRDHIGGNAHDCHDEHGVLIHPYGPHYFRTNSDAVLDYLSQFTDWIPGNYRVQVFRDGRYWSFPINLATFEQYLGRGATEDEMRAWLDEQKVSFERITNSEEAVLSQVGEEWYRMFFEGYTLKQWKRHPRELSPSVCSRIPVRTTRDDRYFNDKHQVLPKDGYHTLFKNLVESCGDRLEIRLNTDYKTVLADESIQWTHHLFTGPIDLYFDYKHGPLPYRSLRFEREYLRPEAGDRRPEAGDRRPEAGDRRPEAGDRRPEAGDRRPERNDACSQPSALSPQPSGLPALRQPCVQVNYPEPTVPYTRCVEAKHITGQQIDGTTIVREYPDDYAPGKEPFYPIPAPDAQALYRKYQAEAEQLHDTTFLGRLGTYRYYNMDQVVAAALKFVERLDLPVKEKIVDRS